MGSPVHNSSNAYNLQNLQSSFIITGPTGGGFDLSVNNGATLRLYNSSTDTYTYPTNINTSVYTGTGFYMFFRGDKTITGNGNVSGTDPFGSKTNLNNASPRGYPVPESVTYTYTGIPNQGNVTTTFDNVAFDNDYYFISNPYAATLDFDQVFHSTDFTIPFVGTFNYIHSQSWTWNPFTQSYAVYDDNNPGSSTNGAKRYIVPGQGFFIRTNNASNLLENLTITESMKATGSSSNAVRLSSAPTPSLATTEPPVMRLQLYKNAAFNDEIGIVLNSTAKDSLDYQDATHLEWNNAILSTITPDNKYLAIDKRSIKNKKTTIPLYVNTTTDSVYTFKNTYVSQSMKQNYRLELYDGLTGDSIDIAHNNYSFRVDLTNPKSLGGSRFKLAIQQVPAPQTVLNFTGKLNADKKGVLDWSSNGYIAGITYQLQRSQDNKTFINVGDPQGIVDSTIASTYELIDNDTKEGQNYYRLVQTDMFNNQTFSNTVLLLNTVSLNAKNSTGFVLYPNPVVSDNFTILGDKNYTGKITLTIYNSNSEVKHTETFSQLSANAPIHENAGQLKLGVYFVELKVDNNVIGTLKFIKQ